MGLVEPWQVHTAQECRWYRVSSILCAKELLQHGDVGLELGIVLHDLISGENEESRG